MRLLRGDDRLLRHRDFTDNPFVSSDGAVLATTDGSTWIFQLPRPTVIALRPAYGPATGGTTVAIEGASLAAASAVDFGSKPAVSSKVNRTGTRIVAYSPSGTGEDDVTVKGQVLTSLIAPADSSATRPR